MQDKVHSAFFRELYKRYFFDDVKTKLKFSDDDKVKSVLKSLKSAGIVKIIDSKKSFELERLQEEEIITDEITTDNSHAFVFNFVGIAYTENSIIKCYPKYIEEEDSEYFLPHFKQVLRVLKKYNNTKDYNLKYFDLNDEGKKFNRMEIELFILEDYFANGIYTNQESVIETNGIGEIDWDRTINNTLAIIKNNKPYYVELQTINNQNNDKDFFKLLHECILTECSHHLGKNGADILELFDMEEVELSGLDLSDFGDNDYIKYRIEQELRNQFVTQKQNLLKILLAYVTEKNFKSQTSDFSFFGTNAFNMVWEKACSSIFDDVKDKKIGELENDKIIKFENYKPNIRIKNSSLKNFIEKVRWTFDENVIPTRETLEPDIITIHDNVFHIFDGKYYLITHDKGGVKNQPGIQDVVKQFAYHKAYYEFLQTTALEKVANVFLIPAKFPCEWNIKFSGTVELGLMQKFAMEILCPISLIELNPKCVFENYLADKKITGDLKNEEAKRIEAKTIVRTSVSTYDWQKDYMPNLRYTMVGLLRKSYIEKIKAAKKDFIFFFYKQKGNIVYPVHNLLPCCDKFIGYNLQCNFLIKGKIYCEKGKFPIQILEKKKLLSELEMLNYKDATRGNADLYYVVKITNIEIIEDRDYNSLKNGITDFEGNDILSDFSPKIIGNF